MTVAGRTFEGELDFTAGAGRRYPARHTVEDADLVRGEVRIPVVVKKTRTDWRQRLLLSKAERSYRTASLLRSLEIPTPEPFGICVLPGETWYVARRIVGAAQMRVWFLHRDDPSRPPPPLPFSFEEIVTALGRLARRLHDAGVFFRDLSDGNVLVSEEGGRCRLWLVDLDRARIGRRVGLFGRLRDLSRPGLNRESDRRMLLASYYAPDAPPPAAIVLLRVFRARLVLWDDFKRKARPWKRRGVSSGLPAR